MVSLQAGVRVVPSNAADKTAHVAKVYGNRWETLDDGRQSGQSRVYRVKDLERGDEGHVLKRFFDQRAIARFEKEIEALEAIDSPYIPRIIDAQTEPKAYYVTTWLGNDLEILIADGWKPRYEEIIEIAFNVASALADAHSVDVIHRDIKPSNIVYSGSRAYLVDFGTCEFRGQGAGDTRHSRHIGHEAFAAPELMPGWAGPGPSRATDVYGLGKVLYFLATGGQYLFRETLSDETMARLPTSDSYLSARPSVLSYLIRRMVQENPQGRMSAEELALVLTTHSEAGIFYEALSTSHGVEVLWDTLGFHALFRGGGSKSVAAKGVADETASRYLATSFVPRQDSEVNELLLPIRLTGDAVPVVVLTSSRGEEGPDLDAVLTTFLGGDVASERTEARFVSSPAGVQAGERFWVVVSADGRGQIQWFTPTDRALTDRRSLSAEWTWKADSFAVSQTVGQAMRVSSRRRT
jgi:hypothetical protein